MPFVVFQTFDNCSEKFWRWHRFSMLRAATSIPPLQPTSKTSKTSFSGSHSSSSTKQEIIPNYIIWTSSASHAQAWQDKRPHLATLPSLQSFI